MKLRELLKVTYQYSDIQLYNTDGEYIGYFLPMYIGEKFLDKEIVEISINNNKAFEILIKK